MAQSLVKLTLESNQYEKGLRNAQRQLNDFTQSIGINMKSLSGMAIAAGAVTTAMKVMKDAFFKNEQQLDEWGRTVQSCDSLYSGFLNSLNNGDIGGFLGKIDQIVSAARRAYDAIDELATYNAFNRMNVSDARAGLSSAIADYRMGTGSKDAVKKANDELKAQLKERQKLERNAYEESVRDIAMQRGANPDDVLRLLGGKYVDFKNMKASYVGEGSFSGQTVKSLFGGATVAGAMSGVNFGTQVRQTPGTDEERLAVFARSLNDTELDKLQAMGEAANNTKREIADLDKQLARVLNGRGGTGGSGGGGRGGRGGRGGGSGSVFDPQSLAGMEQVVGELTKKWRETSGVVRDGYLKDLVEAEAVLNRMKEEQYWAKEIASGKFSGKGNAYFRDSMRNATGLSSGSGLNPSGNMLLNKEAMDALAKAMEKANKQTKKEDKEETKYLSEGLSQLSGGLGGLQSGFSQLGIDLGDGFGSVVSGLQGISTILMAIQAIITGIQTISALDAIIPFARGGIVRAASGTIIGNSYSGDNLRAISAGGQVYGLNAGEVVLNRAQVGNLASQLTGTGLNNLKLDAVITGEQIRLVLNNNGRRTGRGEYVQTKSGRV